MTTDKARWLSHRPWHDQHPPGHPDPTLWFHGTWASFETPEAASVERPSHTRHWNGFLGPHFAHHPDVANMFAEAYYARTMAQHRSGTGIPDGARIIPARLRVQRPRHFESELNLEALAAGLALTHGMIGIGTAIGAVDEHMGDFPDIAPLIAQRTGRHPSLLDWECWLLSPPWELALDAAMNECAGSIIRHGYEREAYTDDFSREEQDTLDSTHHTIASFKRRLAALVVNELRRLGHDSLTYVNTARGEEGLSAVPMEAGQIVQGVHACGGVHRRSSAVPHGAHGTPGPDLREGAA